MSTRMTDAEGLVLEGLERVVVFNRLRAAIGLRWELPRLLQGITIPPGGGAWRSG